MPSRKVTISNRLGLHARPAMMLAECAASFSSEISIRRIDHGDPVDAKSIMQLLMLAGTQGTRLQIEADGVDADRALNAIAALFDSVFDDE
ncbi:MAG: HPr family phosphocarrier protein [Planctomycetota bacterium]|nr:HPr family phosphocarrier protein [Planctomycetota bacterium]